MGENQMDTLAVFCDTFSFGERWVALICGAGSNNYISGSN
jgi:hypothetical protein